jgi:hypothetical protein
LHGIPLSLLDWNIAQFALAKLRAQRRSVSLPDHRLEQGERYLRALRRCRDQPSVTARGHQDIALGTVRSRLDEHAGATQFLDEHISAGQNLCRSRCVQEDHRTQAKYALVELVMMFTPFAAEANRPIEPCTMFAAVAPESICTKR